MKKLSADKNTTWIAYVQSGKLRLYLEHLKLTEHAVESILGKMGGDVYKHDYQELTKCLGSEALQRLNGAIRSANYAAKNNIVNLRVKTATHERLIAVKDLIEADSIDDAVYYLTSKDYEGDSMIGEALDNPSIQGLDNIHGESLESRLYKRLEGLDRRIFGHHYLKSIAPQIAIRARRSSLVISRAKAFKKAIRLGIKPNDLWAMDFGDERRKVYPVFQFNYDMTTSIDFNHLIESSRCYPDQLWFSALHTNIWSLESNDGKDKKLFINLMLRDVETNLDDLIKAY